MSIHDQRAAAVAEAMARVHEIERRHGVTGAMLDEVKAVMIALGNRAELFPWDHFPIPEGSTGRIYRLAEDADLRFALYAAAGVKGRAQPPHDHTTWAVIAGIHGDEHNVFYRRTDNRQTPGRGTIEKTGELTVRRGNAVGFMPNDFHTIESRGGEPTLHLHCYGLSLEHLPGRIFFSSSTGGDYAHFPANPNIATPTVEAAELKRMISDGGELAILDAREEGVFAKRHLLFAVPLPLSRLEMRVDALVPRRSTRIVLCDETGEGLAEKAALKLLHFGYRNLSILRGGVEAWAAAGYELFSGVHVPSKAFGEFIEHREGTPRLSAAAIKAKLDASEDLVILDSRPFSEYRAMNIPDGIDCPGAELVHRVHDMVKSPKTLVVVNCAGRTRSIIGAQSLINAGLPNPVAALENGTMGWHLAGFELERGADRVAPPPSPEGLAQAREAAARVARRFGVTTVDSAALARFMAERDRRSLYLLDVRSPEEYSAGHIEGARSAPGGQLVQATDAYVGTRHARLVLVDDNGVRATMTASWLIQMGGFEVYVLAGGLGGRALVTGAEHPRVLDLDRAVTTTIDAAALKAALDRDEVIVADLESSLRYREAHIPGAWHAIRARLAASLPKLGRAAMLVLTSADGMLARLAAPEAAKLTDMKVVVLAGGTAAWRAAGLPLATGEERMADDTDDVWYRPYDRKRDDQAAMNAYLTWEIDLPAQIARDGDAKFCAFPKG
ncbi:MAG: sulfurtransferase [Alphaproteobacteria bacterium]|nr:sulfurtransferase [Alphaproteobacteria bacterium]